MGEKTEHRPFLKTALLGAVSIASYVVLYSRQDLVTEYFTRGGKYVVLPVATALYFSLVHGAFTSCLFDVLGIRAAKNAKKELSD